jgi:hypothetical protein
VRFRNAGGAVVQVIMRSDFFATEAFFRDHGRHPFLEQRRGPGGLRVMALRITSSGTPHCSAIESNTAPSQGGTAGHQEKPDPPWARLFPRPGVSGATAPADVKRGLRNAKADEDEVCGNKVGMRLGPPTDTLLRYRGSVASALPGGAKLGHRQELYASPSNSNIIRMNELVPSSLVDLVASDSFLTKDRDQLTRPADGGDGGRNDCSDRAHSRHVGMEGASLRLHATQRRTAGRIFLHSGSSGR